MLRADSRFNHFLQYSLNPPPVRCPLLCYVLMASSWGQCLRRCLLFSHPMFTGAWNVTLKVLGWMDRIVYGWDGFRSICIRRADYGSLAIFCFGDLLLRSWIPIALTDTYPSFQHGKNKKNWNLDAFVPSGPFLPSLPVGTLFNETDVITNYGSF